MKKLKYLIFMLLCFTPMFVMAESSVYYTTKNGDELTEKQYYNLREIFTDEELDEIGSTVIDAIKDDENLAIATEEVYYKTEDTNIGLLSLSREYEIEEEQALQEASIVPYGSSSSSYQTTYKKLTVQVVSSTSGNLEYLTITSTLNWLKEPKYKTYDVWAMRFNAYKCFGVTSTYATYKKTMSESAWSDNVIGIPTNIQIKDYGFGHVISVDTSKIDSKWVVKVQITSRPSTVRVTYQHAQGSIAYANTYDFDISSSGYGGVVYFNTSAARNVYDQMSGVSVTPNYS